MDDYSLDDIEVGVDASLDHSQIGVQDVPDVVQDSLEEVAPKAKRKPLYDTERLLADDGLPKLRKRLLQAKFKDRKTTRRDLSKLLSIYELWSHRHYPRSNQQDILEILSKAGDNGRVKMFRRGLVDEDKYGSVQVQAAPDDPVLEARFNVDSVTNDNANGTSNDKDTDSEIDLDLPTAPIRTAQIDDSSDDDQPQAAQTTQTANNNNDDDEDEQWRIYKELGF